MKKYSIDPSNTTAFNNNACVCIGTGRLALALRAEYQKQLETVQKEIGFTYIRGHGLFCDDMAVYHTYEQDGETKEEYNFTYIDAVFDMFLSLGLRPFVELGFMPSKMASGEQTVFYWRGNVTPPSDYGKWERLIITTVEHWISRYGADEVISWPFEVWNEPNLPVFWKNADMNEYFKLYEISARALKRCDERIHVGGPAICGVDDERWMRKFLEFCKKNSVPLDFVTRHAYGTELPEAHGHYVYQELKPPAGFMSEPLTSREIIDSFPEFAGLKMHITEFNTSYNPKNPIHDTNLNAAYTAEVLSVLGDSCSSYSYWTFGDVFEEAGVAFTPFSGCFGLMANGLIKKPTYWVFVFYKRLYPKAAAKEANFVLTKDDKGNLRGVAWNLSMQGREDLPLQISCAVEKGSYFMQTETVDETVCNPQRVWIQMGQPPYPSEDELMLLRRCAVPSIATYNPSAVNNVLEITLNLTPNAVMFFDIKKITPHTDRGFMPERVSGALEQTKRN